MKCFCNKCKNSYTIEKNVYKCPKCSSVYVQIYYSKEEKEKLNNEVIKDVNSATKKLEQKN